MRRLIQLSYLCFALVIVISWAASAPSLLLLYGPPDRNPDRPEIRETTLFIAPLWTVGVVLLPARTAPDVPGINTTRRLARLAYTNAYLLYLLHVAVAFHLGHGWSHVAAMEHVEEESGFGPGIYVSYLFTLIWTADVVWWWAAPRSYAHRPRWVTGGVQGFLGFVIFNATVVYGSAPMRWFVLPAFVVLAWSVVAPRRWTYARA